MKYLFSAQFSNTPEIYHQQASDISVLDPEKRSAFYDVKQNEENLVKFELYNPENKNDYIVVNLTNGSFRINGLDVFLHDQEKEKIEKFRIIYFRNMETKLYMDGSSTPPQILAFNVGWQGLNHKGENIQRIIKVS